MERILNKKTIVPTAVFAAIIAVWEFAVRITNTPLYILPAPSKIISAMISERDLLMSHGAVTLGETLIGLLIATLFGIVLAIVMDRFGLFRLAAYPILVVTQTVPVIVLAPIFIIYLGFGMAPKILVVVLMCFFPIVISFADGMKQVDENQVNLAKLFGANPLQVYSMVKIPAAASSLFSGLKVAATYSISGAIVGEWLSSSSGLGYYMLRAKNGFMLDKVFACVVVVVLLSLLLNGGVRLMQHITMPHLREKFTGNNSNTNTNLTHGRDNMKKKLLSMILILAMIMSFAACGNGSGVDKSNLQDVTVVLDFIPNTNHTGLYVAKELGYYEEMGLNVEIIEPTDGATPALIAAGKGDFGVTYQEDLTYALTSEDPLPIKAIATLIQHNTSGFGSYAGKHIKTPKDFEGKTYAGWGSASEEAAIHAIMNADGGDFSKLKMVTADGVDYTSLKDNIDFIWMFWAWDGISAKRAGVDINYMEIRQLDERLDYYTPILIASNDTIESNPELAQKFMDATKKGYEYAIANPNESAEILHKYADTYDLEMLKESQAYISTKYSEDSDIWGLMKDSVWEGYTGFMVENGLINKAIPASECYTNQFLTK